MKDTENDSLLDGMRPWQWDAHTSVQLEVAVNIINLLIPRYRERIRLELQASDPDQEQIRRWEDLTGQAAQDRGELTPSNPAAVRSALDHYSRLYREEAR